MYRGNIESDFDISDHTYSQEVLQPIQVFLERCLVGLRERVEQQVAPPLLWACREMAAHVPPGNKGMQARTEYLASKAFCRGDLCYLCDTMVPTIDDSVHSQLHSNMQERIVQLIC